MMLNFVLFSIDRLVTIGQTKKKLILQALNLCFKASFHSSTL